MQRLRHALREYFPAALDAFDDLTAADALELLAQGTRPGRGGPADHRADHRRAQRARRRNVADRAEQIQAALRAEQLGQPPVLAAAYAATVRATVAVLTTLNDADRDHARGGGGPFWPAPGR